MNPKAEVVCEYYSDGNGGSRCLSADDRNIKQFRVLNFVLLKSILANVNGLIVIKQMSSFAL